MLIAFPYLFPPPVLNEKVEQMTAGALLGESQFRPDARGQDPAHWGRGSIKIYQAQDADGGFILELQEDFEVGPGPNFWLYTNAQPDIDDEADFLADSQRVKVTKLKSFSGSQVYHIEASAAANAKAITIWCESFNQYIASANLP